MDYQDELRAKLDAIHAQNEDTVRQVSDVETHDERLLDEIAQELEFSQYDLDETDILRTLKIMDNISMYPKVFAHKSALKLFYILCRIDAITPKALLRFSGIKTDEFKSIVNSMARYGLVIKNDHNELELTMDAQSLAERIGIPFY